MGIEFPDGTARQLHDRWRDEVDAYCRYLEQRNEETRAEYLRFLRIFTDLVVRNKLRRISRPLGAFVATPRELRGVVAQPLNMRFSAARSLCGS